MVTCHFRVDIHIRSYFKYDVAERPASKDVGATARTKAHTDLKHVIILH